MRHKTGEGSEAVDFIHFLLFPLLCYSQPLNTSLIELS